MKVIYFIQIIQTNILLLFIIKQFNFYRAKTNLFDLPKGHIITIYN